METTFINSFILIPLLGFLLSLLLPKANEKLISNFTVTIVGIHFISFIGYFIYWLIIGHPTLNIKDIVLYKSQHYEFFIDFCFDKITAIYLFTGSFLTFMVTIYCKSYMHRENDYKRFFNTILFFYIGYNITIFAGNFETLFMGWEVLGISSFLLIAFYRDRYLPVKNAMKVFSVYRIGDVGLILAMWASHHLWHENITFLQLSNAELVHEHLQNHSWTGIFISLMILLAAAAKSAQLPFSSWLPRAMEGPTPSSAIFYGSLSVHFGVFLLLRTFPFWENQISVRIVIALLGLFTSIITALIARVQSTIKSQIAYASIAQIGLIFIEVALGFENFALFHFMGNAFIRTYQLLVSPSSITYLIREQVYNFMPRLKTLEDSFPKKLEYSLYKLSLKEFNIESFMNLIIWKPLKKAGRVLNFLTLKRLFLYFIPAYIIGLTTLFFSIHLPIEIIEYLPASFAAIGLLMVLKSFSERKSPIMSWLLIILNHLWIVLAISFNEHFEIKEASFYLVGILIAGVLGYLVLRRLKLLEKNINLNQFNGHSYEHPKLALVFLLSSLGLMGFPITTTFIGEDLVFSHIHEDQFFLALFISISFIVDGLSVVRIYGRLFLGPHIKNDHSTPYKSS